MAESYQSVERSFLFLPKSFDVQRSIILYFMAASKCALDIEQLDKTIKVFQQIHIETFSCGQS